MKSIILILLLAISAVAAPKGWPKQVQEIKYPSMADNTRQPALFYAPTVRGEPRPLLVGLHSWSSDYKQTMSVPYSKWCIEKKWNFIHPNFRGPNRRPEATGSELVVADILSAVEYAKKIGAVNCVFKNNNSFGGTNTDIVGFEKTYYHKGRPKIVEIKKPTTNLGDTSKCPFWMPMWKTRTRSIAKKP